VTKYYVEFKTWAEGRIETPWPFVWFEETDEYRRRDDTKTPIPSQVTKSTFLTFNETSYRRFLDDHVAAVVIGAVIDVLDQRAVLAEIENVFGPCEIIGCMEITEANQELVEKMMCGS
jgi:hypothetical protein